MVGCIGCCGDSSGNEGLCVVGMPVLECSVGFGSMLVTARYA